MLQVLQVLQVLLGRRLLANTFNPDYSTSPTFAIER